MKKKLLAISILLCGLSLIAYGLITAPVSNESEILNHYECGRITQDLRPTDKYCSDPKSAPEAKQHFENMFVYTGIAIAGLGILYAVITNPKKK